MKLPSHELDLLAHFHDHPLTPSKSIHQVSVFLYKEVNLFSTSGNKRYTKGPALIPSDLARLLFRIHSAIPLKSYRSIGPKAPSR